MSGRDRSSCSVTAPPPPLPSVRLELSRDLLHPAPALFVVQGQHLREGPMCVPSEKGCLLADPVQGVADYPPSSGTSTSCSSLQCGQVTVSTRGLSPLIRL